MTLKNALWLRSMKTQAQTRPHEKRKAYINMYKITVRLVVRYLTHELRRLTALLEETGDGDEILRLYIDSTRSAISTLVFTAFTDEEIRAYFTDEEIRMLVKTALKPTVVASNEKKSG